MAETAADGDGWARFAFWRMAGRKRLFHDGQRLVLSCHAAAGSQLATLGGALADGRPFGYVLPAGASPARWGRLVERAAQRLQGACAYTVMPERSAVAHMRALLALDAQAAGASHVQIAAALFGKGAVEARWGADGELRARVRDALARGRTHVAGRWRTLVWPGPAHRET